MLAVWWLSWNFHVQISVSWKNDIFNPPYRVGDDNSILSFVGANLTTCDGWNEVLSYIQMEVVIL